MSNPGAPGGIAVQCDFPRRPLPRQAADSPSWC